MQTVYVRGADLFRQVLNELRADDLTRPVPSCPGWTVSDVVTHVHDNHVVALGPERSDVDDVMAAYALAIPDAPDLAASAAFDTVDLTLHAWDIALACGVELRLGDDQLAFLEAFAAEAGDRLYVEEDGFVRLEGERADPSGLDRQGLALLPFGRRL
ncbi:maleylpyruvate isomerase N-terminal domain-containing protein [Nocardioides luti]|nr:maleylpyruvate isomerase N-terminal domain-containing protein [Nocardioides luti]